MKTTLLLSLLFFVACGSEVSGPEDSGDDAPVDASPRAPAEPSVPETPATSPAAAAAQPVLFSVQTSIPEAGDVRVSPAKASYVAGDVVTLTPPASGAYAFVKWSGGDYRGSPLTITLDGDTSITAIVVPVPRLAGPTVVTGPVNIPLVYSLDWGSSPPKLVSSIAGFTVEEAGAASGPFTAIHTDPGAAINHECVLNLQRPAGDYFYRVRAMTPSGMTPYSAVLHVQRLRERVVLRVINDLPGVREWGQYNQAIRLRVAANADQILSAVDKLSPREMLSTIGASIRPGETKDYDIDEFAGRPFYVYIQTGYWDQCIGTYGTCFEIHPIVVMSCQLNVAVAKYAGIAEPPQSEGIRVLRMSDFLPQYDYYGSWLCL